MRPHAALFAHPAPGTPQRHSKANTLSACSSASTKVCHQMYGPLSRACYPLTRPPASPPKEHRPPLCLPLQWANPSRPLPCLPASPLTTALSASADDDAPAAPQRPTHGTQGLHRSNCHSCSSFRMACSQCCCRPRLRPLVPAVCTLRPWTLDFSPAVVFRTVLPAAPLTVAPEL
jgi:hypothetical protein